MRAEVDGARVPKFRGADALHLVVAGGTAGRFSAWIPGWPFRGAPSRLVPAGDRRAALSPGLSP